MLEENTNYRELNAKLNLLTLDGKIDFSSDKEATRQYFLNHVNQNTVFFHSLEEKMEYLINNDYYEEELIDKYSFNFIKELFKYAYSFKFRFETFMGACKFYTQYALKTFDGRRYIERYEDRVCMNALLLADGNESLAKDIVKAIIKGEFQPATPTFLNAGKKQRGEYVSCFLINSSDSMESIGRTINSALQLSKRGGGVAINLSNLRETGAPIKKIENQSSGVVPVMKILEDSFSYANQLGARQGAGVVYLNVFHKDILNFLDTKRENADEKIRIKTLSLGVVIPDIMFELARNNEDMCLFSPYEIEKFYGTPFTEISITEKYREMVDNEFFSKKKINARELFATLAEIQFESGYPYILFEDNANKTNPIKGRISMSNLCVHGDTMILTDNGYRKVIDLYNSQEDFNVVVDKRARDNDINNIGVSIEKSTKMFKTAEQAQLYKLKTKDGFEIRATDWHKFYAKRGNDFVKVPLIELKESDELLIQSGKGSFGKKHNPELAYILGGLYADGTIVNQENNSKSVKIYLYGDKKIFKEKYEYAIEKVLTGRDDLIERQSVLSPKFGEVDSNDKVSLISAPLYKLLKENGVYHKFDIPEFIWQGTEETQVAFISGLFQLDGCITGSEKNKSLSIELSSIEYDFIVDIQRILLNHGVFAKIYDGRKASKSILPDGNGGSKEYNTKDIWSLRVTGRENCNKLYELVDWLPEHKEKWQKLNENRQKNNFKVNKYLTKLLSIEKDCVADVFDVTVENGNSLIFNGLATGNCVEILQVSELPELNEDLSYKKLGKDISCNLGSLNIAKTMDSDDIEKTVETAIRALSAVSDLSNLSCVPSIKNGNAKSHAIGLGQMNLHGFLSRERIYYGSEESIDFVDVYFRTILYYALKASNKIAKERGIVFDGFENSKYASGEFFNEFVRKTNVKGNFNRSDKITYQLGNLYDEFGKKYEITEIIRFGNSVQYDIDPRGDERYYTTSAEIRGDIELIEYIPKTEKVRNLFKGIYIPTAHDWAKLQYEVMKYGLYNQNLQAIPPTGSISYINNSTASIHPIPAKIEIRKEGKMGRLYYPAPFMTNDNIDYYQDAYEVGYEKIIDVYAAAQKYVDQGMSLTLFFPDTVTTRDLNKAQIYAWRKGIKTLYYVRLRQEALEGSEDKNICVSCSL